MSDTNIFYFIVESNNLFLLTVFIKKKRKGTHSTMVLWKLNCKNGGGRSGCDRNRIVVRFTTICAISAYHH